MRDSSVRFVILAALLGLVGIAFSLPMKDEHDVGNRLAALSLKDAKPSAASSTHPSGSPSKQMEVDHSDSAGFKYAIASPTTRTSHVPDVYTHHFIDPHAHHPEHVTKWTNSLDHQYYKGNMYHNVYQNEKSRAKVAAEGVHHIMNGRPVRLALHDGVQVLHTPGKMDAALDAHFKDNIHEIVSNSNHDEPFRINPPRNKAGRTLSADQSKGLQMHLDGKVAEARLMKDQLGYLTKKRYDPKTGMLREVRIPPSFGYTRSEREMRKHESYKAKQRKRNKQARAKPY
jgi:hypothetical protein